MVSDVQGQQAPAPGTPPVISGDSGQQAEWTPDERAKAYAKQVAEDRIKGILKEQEKRDKRLAELESADEKRKRDALSAEERAAKLAADLEASNKRICEFEAERQAELAALAEENEKAMKGWTKEWSDLVPDSLDPKSKAKLIAKVSALKEKSRPQTQNVNGGAGRTARDDLSPEEHGRSLADDLHSKWANGFRSGK